ncbi:MAG TPA: hypothetical protein VFA20_15275, partial [Myxococcaceae bacterium]|nr:hypothetical protein [Myxococcaceae bacterium]
GAGQDRYPPYRQGFAAAPVVAYVFHPSDPRLPPEAVEQWLRQSGARYERRQAGRYTYFIQYRP